MNKVWKWPTIPLTLFPDSTLLFTPNIPMIVSLIFVPIFIGSYKLNIFIQIVLDVLCFGLVIWQLTLLPAAMCIFFHFVVGVYRAKLCYAPIMFA